MGITERVKFFGPIKKDDLIDYYNSFNVFVLPSKTTKFWKEQYGMVLVEAMGCEKAIVGSSSGAIPEVLFGYPKHMIFKEGDINDLKDKIEKVQKLKIPVNFDLKGFLYKYSIENYVKQTIDFYNLIGGYNDVRTNRKI